MIANFVNEMLHLLDGIPAEQWEDPDRFGLLYEIVPWHRMSSATIQVRDDDPNDIGGWKYYYSVDSDASRICSEIDSFLEVRGRLAYHKMLLEAAEALLSIDLSRYIPHMKSVEDGFLHGPFRVQVYDVDRSFKFNYCEYLLARRLDGS